MPHTILDVATARGTMPVHVHTPDGPGPFPLVVLYMDSLGIRPALHDHARRLAGAGYAAALPDLFYFVDSSELPDIERLKAGDQEEFARMGSLVARVDDGEVLADTERMLQALPAADRPWGCVGFCMGGRFGLLAAERFGEGLAAAALLHPSRLVTDEPASPHRLVQGIRGALYLAYGERDHVTPPETIPPLRDELERHGVEHRIEVIPDADHGYTMPGMPSYDERAAQRAWRGTLELLARKLR